jgi:ERCC4-related helicase
MTWSMSDRVDLRSPQINPEDARRQKKTAAEILRRLQTQPGQILADEVGMGKTFVALAVAVSVIEATKRAKPVVVMVPPSVGRKWPLEWKKMASSLGAGPAIRATESSVSSAAEFLKLLDDKPSERVHLIFLTHGALTSGLSDPLVRLAIIQRALRSPRLARQRKIFPRWAERVIQGLHTQRFDEDLVGDLLGSSPARWSDVIASRKGTNRLDDPVPEAILAVLPNLDLGRLRTILEHDLPLRSSPNINTRLPFVRASLTTEVAALWRTALRQLHLRMPLLILDEAHHPKNPYTRLAGLFANKLAAEESETLTRGELGGVFDRMLFLTATPFQLGHNELIEVLERFNGVCWDGLDRLQYDKQLEDLRRALDASQAAALRLDRSWGHLSIGDVPSENEAWWEHPEREDLSARGRGVAAHWVDARNHAKRSERLLRPHVIRHVRADRLSRREILCGAALVSDDAGERGGLVVSQRAVLPFLLAARAQALVAMHRVRDHRQARAVFAEGLASSFEAYTKTRTSHDLAEEVDERVLSDIAPLPDEVAWYLSRISGALPDDDDEALREHPKMQATVKRVVQLWREREKALVFCFYVATGRALRRHIAKAIEREIVSMGAKKLRLDDDDVAGVHAALDRFRERLFTINSPSRRYATAELRRCLRASLSGEDLDAGVDRCLRFLRTYSFLVRYVDLSRPSVNGMREAFAKPDASGRTFRQVVGDFGRFMADREPDERALFFRALNEIDIGDIGVRDDEGEREQLIANVRLANGSVARQVRERLMIAFNTPFYPEVLIASSVMAEGVDLHLTCRHVVHHDLDWNPSVIEQRTGRLDRIGSKGEMAKLPVKVYLPFIEGAQDEKQFRVMRDRERWFNVVMGERLELDEWSTDRLAERVGLPDAAAAGVAMDLAIARQTGSRGVE